MLFSESHTDLGSFTAAGIAFLHIIHVMRSKEFRKKSMDDLGDDRRFKHSLDRIVFTTSRLAEFCSEKELVNKTGHDSDDWPLVVLKELIDNALDACEEAGAAPVIHVAVSDAEIAVFDNGPGIAPETVSVTLDYNTRTSGREAYVSPTRAAQGNALKTLLAMPFALDGERGETTIESRGVAHRITFSIDPIRQEPRLVRVCEDCSVKSGTRVAVSWPISACSILD